MSFPSKALQGNLYSNQDIVAYKHPLITFTVKQGLEYVKKRVWPWLQKLKGYGKFREPDDIYVSDELDQGKPAVTVLKRDSFGRIKKYLVVSKDILLFPWKMIEYILAHESGHISQGIGGNLVDEAVNDKNLADVYKAKGEKEMARLIETHSGYLNRLYGLFRKISSPFSCYYYIVKNRNI